MKILLLIATLKLSYCAQINFSEAPNFNFTNEDLNLSDVIITPDNVGTTPDFTETSREANIDENNSTSNLQDGLEKASLYYTVGTLDVGPNQGFLSKLLNVSEESDFDKLLVLAKTKDVEHDVANNSTVIVDTAHLFNTDITSVEIEPIVQIIDSNNTEEYDTTLENEKYKPVTDVVTVSFGHEFLNEANFHLSTKRSIEHKNDSVDLTPSNLEMKPQNMEIKQSDNNNKKRHLSEEITNPPSELQNNNFENIHFSNGNGNIPHQSKENDEALINRSPTISQSHVPTQTQDLSSTQNFENSVLTMVSPPENLEMESQLPNNNFNPILTSRSAFVDDDDDDDNNDQQNFVETRQSTSQESNPINSNNVATILKTLEQKVENIADLVKKTCGTNNEIPTPDKQNFVGSSKHGLDDNLQDPANVALHKVHTEKFPNNLVQPNKNKISNTQQDAGDVVGDINQELLSEVDGEKPASKNQLADSDVNKISPQSTPSLLSRFGSKKKPLENLLSNLEAARSEDGNLPESKLHFTKIKDLFPKHKPLLKPLIPSRASHGFGKKSPFLQSLTGAKNPLDQNQTPSISPKDDSSVIPKERVGDSFDYDAEEEPSDQEAPIAPNSNTLDPRPIENFMKNTLHIPTVEELLHLAHLRNKEAANNLFKNVKPILPKLDLNRPIVQPTSLLNGEDDPMGVSRGALTPLTDRLNSRPRLNLFKNSPLNRNVEPENPNVQNTNSLNEDPLIPEREVEEPSVPEIGQRFADTDADFEDPSDNGVLGSRVPPNPYTNLGRVVLPKNRGINSPIDQMIFEGTGINLPIKVARNDDGSYQLSVDADKMCNKCVGNSCNEDNIVGSSINQDKIQPKRFNLAERLLNSRNSENKNKLILEPNQIKSRLIGKAENYIERQKSLLDSKTKNEGLKEKSDSIIKSPATMNRVEEQNKLFDIPQMRARFAERAHSLIDRQKNLLESKTQTLFPRLSQVAKRSPKLLFSSPLLTLNDNAINERNIESLEDFDNSAEDLKKNTFGTIGDKKDRVKKRVAIVKNVLTWMKGIGNTTT